MDTDLFFLRARQRFQIRGSQNLHLANGDLIEPLEPFALRQSQVKEFGVHAFHVCQDEQLLDARVIANVAFQFGIGVTPLPGGVAKEGDVQQIRFRRVGDGCLRGCDEGGDEMRLHRVRVDAVIQLRKRAVEIPREREAAILVFLEALEFLDEIKPELDRNPRGEFKRDVLVRVSAAITPRLRNQPNGARRINPALGRQNKAVQPCLFSNPIEFDGIKTRVVQPLPKTQELNRVPIPHPVLDEVIRPLTVFVTGDVRETDVVLLLPRQDGDNRALDFDDGFLGLAHGCLLLIRLRS